MAVESKPLFHPEVIRQHLRSFVLPEAVDRSRLKHWADLIASGQANKMKETDLLPDFLTDIFCNLLGYTRPAGSPDLYTLSRETHVEVDGQFADAVLGRFQPDAKKFTVALEGKGTTDPLERPFGGRRMSAVDQAYRYAINLPCDWIIVTSMRETRLYHKGANQQTYERFETARLATDEALLRRFVFLLGAARIVPDTGDCHLHALLKESESVGRALTNKFYALYANIRQKVFTRLRDENSAIAPQEILRCTQKLLDRILFCAFCEDRSLLPPETVRRAFAHSDPYNPKPIWDNFRGLFRSVDVGNSGLKIPAYNGGLFAHDPHLDGLLVPDDVCAHFQDLAEYDFRPAREVSEADESREIRAVIDVDILGHIFEQSITDLERIREDIESGGGTETGTQAKTRRKKEGAFYTPAFITRYIVEQTLGPEAGGDPLRRSRGSRVPAKDVPHRRWRDSGRRQQGRDAGGEAGRKNLRIRRGRNSARCASMGHRRARHARRSPRTGALFPSCGLRDSHSSGMVSGWDGSGRDPRSGQRLSEHASLRAGDHHLRRDRIALPMVGQPRWKNQERTRSLKPEHPNNKKACPISDRPFSIGSRWTALRPGTESPAEPPQGRPAERGRSALPARIRHRLAADPPVHPSCRIRSPQSHRPPARRDRGNCCRPRIRPTGPRVRSRAGER
jgi:hypothetical protein